MTAAALGELPHKWDCLHLCLTSSSLKFPKEIGSMRYFFHIGSRNPFHDFKVYFVEGPCRERFFI